MNNFVDSDEIKRIVLETLARSSTSALANRINDQVADAHQVENKFNSTKKKITLYCDIDRKQRDVLSEAYGEFQIEFKAGPVNNHGMANALRTMEQLSFLRKHNFYGVVIDVGGNPTPYFHMGCTNVVSYKPLSDARDAARYTRQHAAIHGALRRGHKANAPPHIVKAYNEWGSNYDYFVRRCRAEEDDLEAAAVMFLHSLYDIGPAKMAEIMSVHKAKVGEAVVMFDPEIICSPATGVRKGVIEVLNCMWEITARNGVSYVRFSFIEDESLNYEHELRQYIDVMTVSHVRHGTDTYLLERLVNLGRCIITITKCANGGEVSGHLSFNYWAHLRKNIVRVPVLEYRHQSLAPSTAAYSLRYVDTDRELMNRLVSYGKVTSEEKRDQAELEKYYRGTAVHTTVNGVDVGVKSTQNPEEVTAICVTAWYRAYLLTYAADKIVRTLRTQQTAVRNLRNDGFLSLVKQRILLELSPITGNATFDLPGIVSRVTNALRASVEDRVLELADTPLYRNGDVLANYSFEEEVALLNELFTDEEGLDAVDMELVRQAKMNDDADRIRHALDSAVELIRSNVSGSADREKAVNTVRALERELLKLDPKYVVGSAWSEKEVEERKLDKFVPLLSTYTEDEYGGAERSVSKSNGHCLFNCFFTLTGECTLEMRKKCAAFSLTVPAALRSSLGPFGYQDVHDRCIAGLVKVDGGYELKEDVGVEGWGNDKVATLLAHMYGVFVTINVLNPKEGRVAHVRSFGPGPSSLTLNLTNDHFTVDTYTYVSGGEVSMLSCGSVMKDVRATELQAAADTPLEKNDFNGYVVGPRNETRGKERGMLSCGSVTVDVRRAQLAEAAEDDSNIQQKQLEDHEVIYTCSVEQELVDYFGDEAAESKSKGYANEGREDGTSESPGSSEPKRREEIKAPSSCDTPSHAKGEGHGYQGRWGCLVVDDMEQEEGVDSSVVGIPETPSEFLKESKRRKQKTQKKKKTVRFVEREGKNKEFNIDDFVSAVGERTAADEKRGKSEEKEAAPKPIKQFVDPVVKTTTRNVQAPTEYPVENAGAPEVKAWVSGVREVASKFYGLFVLALFIGGFYLAVSELETTFQAPKDMVTDGSLYCEIFKTSEVCGRYKHIYTPIHTLLEGFFGPNITRPLFLIINPFLGGFSFFHWFLSFFMLLSLIFFTYIFGVKGDLFITFLVFLGKSYFKRTSRLGVIMNILAICVTVATKSKHYSFESRRCPGGLTAYPWVNYKEDHKGTTAESALNRLKNALPGERSFKVDNIAEACRAELEAYDNEATELSPANKIGRLYRVKQNVIANLATLGRSLNHVLSDQYLGEVDMRKRPLLPTTVTTKSYGAATRQTADYVIQPTLQVLAPVKQETTGVLNANPQQVVPAAVSTSSYKPRRRNDCVASKPASSSREDPLNDYKYAAFDNYRDYVRLEILSLEEDMRALDAHVLANAAIPKSFQGMAASRCAGLEKLHRVGPNQYASPNDWDKALCVYDQSATSTKLDDTTNEFTPAVGAIIPIDKVEVARDGSIVHVASSSPYVYISIDLSDFLSLRVLRTLENCGDMAFDNRRTFLNKAGVAACGKTYSIAMALKPGDIALATTHSAVDELKNKLEELKTEGKVHISASDVVIKTVGSYILSNKRQKSGLVHIDEAIMMHPGEVYMVAELAEAHTVIGYADPLQLKFIPRVANWVMEEPEIRWTTRETNMITRLTPMDATVAGRFLEFGGYGSEYKTMSSVVRSMSTHKISSPRDVPKRTGDVLYLTYTKDERNTLLDLGYKNVKTIGASQGGRADHVILVRLARILPDSLVKNGPQRLVAMTRHRRTFSYYSVDPQGGHDFVTLAINRIASIPDIKREHDEPAIIIPTNPAYAEIAGGYEYVEEASTLFTDAAKAAFNKIHGWFGNIMRPTTLYKEKDGPDFSYDNEVSEVSNTPRTPRLSNIAATLSEAYGRLMPGVGDDLREYHNTIRNLSSINVAANGYFATDFGRNPLPRAKPSFRPLVHTDQEPLRTNTARDYLHALNKRNMAAHKTRLWQQPGMKKQMLEHALRVWWGPDWRRKLEIVRANPKVVDNVSLSEFMKAQTDITIKTILASQLTFADFELKNYNMILRKTCKAADDVGAAKKWAQPQVIVFMTKLVNAVFGPLMRGAFDDFILHCREGVCVNKGKSLASLEQYVNNYYPDRPYEFVENDFSNYDKTQDDLSLDLELTLLEMFGFDTQLLGMWRSGHSYTRIKSHEAGFILRTLFQRKSGDVTTSFGNTLINMVIVAWCYFEDPTVADLNLFFALFLGDDSLLCTDRGAISSVALNRGGEKMSNDANVQGKVLVALLGYFCGLFFIDVDYKFVVMSDPLRRLSKMGRWDIVDEKDFKENYISLLDNLRHYNNETYCELLAKTCYTRWEMKREIGDIRLAIMALSSIMNNFKGYRECWGRKLEARPV